MKLYLGILSLCGALIYTGAPDGHAKTDLNKVLNDFGLKSGEKKNRSEQAANLNEAQKNEIRLINSFLERLRTIKRQVEKEEKELMDTKEKLLLGQ